MKDIFSKLKNFLSEPTSTMAMIGTLIVLVAAFFVTPDRFGLVLVSFLALFAVIAMRIVEVWMSTDPLTAEKYVRRREKVGAIDEECTVQK